MKKKHTVAVIFMAVAVAASIPLGINKSLERMRDDVENSYLYDQTGYNIGNGIEARRAAASNLISLAKKYREKNPELDELIDELDYRVSLSEHAWYDLDYDEVRANYGMDAPAQALADALENTELNEQDRKYPQQMIKQMKSEQDKINRSSYNDEARAYNDKVYSLKPMAMAEPMGVFDEPMVADVVEQTAVMDDGIAEETYVEAGTAEDWERSVEEWSGRVEQRAERLGDEIDQGVENMVDGIMDSIFG